LHNQFNYIQAVQRIKIKELLAKKPIGDTVCVKGWVRTKRTSKQVTFIMLNDGSTIHNLQLVIDAGRVSEETLQTITTGASLSVQGIAVTSPGEVQSVELQATNIEVLGTALDYPLQPKKHSLEFLREIGHLRFRTSTFGAVFRVRHAISYAIHQFFHEEGFFYLHTPIITAIDAEGAGETFGVSTFNMTQIPKAPDGQVDFKKDFFSQKTSLTVSGQLQAEAAAMGLGSVYTFGPTFRAENSNTARHLAEFWMVEPEVAFNELADNIALAESFCKYVIQFVLNHCQDDLTFLQKRALESQPTHQQAQPLLAKLDNVLSHPFACITYTEAIDILKSSKPNQLKKFSYPIQSWGCDLQSEHERYLVEEHFKKPVTITHYPSAIKAFYMRQESDGQTVAAMDVLFPGIGEVIGGSQREERLHKLTEAIHNKGIHPAGLQWYLDTRFFGTVPHSGFGLGLERLVQFITDMDNIRDVIAFPRTPGHADF
jgi:asparaginyl-tRNA synthetase